MGPLNYLFVAAVLLSSCYASDIKGGAPGRALHSRGRNQYENCNNGVGCCRRHNDKGERLYCFYKDAWHSMCETLQGCWARNGVYDCAPSQGHCGSPRTYGYPDASRDEGAERDAVYDQEAVPTADFGMQNMQSNPTPRPSTPPASTPPASNLIAEKDFESALRQRNRFRPEDFFSRFPAPNPTPNPAPKGGSIHQFTVDQAPFLGSLPSNGMAQALITLEMCGINQPHVHPRGTEVAHVLQGEIFFGLVEENTGRFVNATLQQGQSFVFPAGLFHFVQNLGCNPVKFLASFDHRDPGTVTFASNFFRFPDSTLQATLGLPAAAFQQVRDSARAQINPSQDPVCLRRCVGG